MTATSIDPSSSAPVERVRRLCLALPATSERLSHGEPTFFVAKRVFVMFADNHHGDGRVAVWLPAPPGVQSALIEQAPAATRAGWASNWLTSATTIWNFTLRRRGG